jgi:hypothetical protein
MVQQEAITPLSSALIRDIGRPIDLLLLLEKLIYVLDHKSQLLKSNLLQRASMRPLRSFKQHLLLISIALFAANPIKHVRTV